LTHVQRSRLQLIAAGVLFSTAGAALKACTLDSWQVTGFRAAIAALTVLALVPEARRGLSTRAAVVAVVYAVTAVLFVRANKMTTAASTIFLQSASPLYIILLAPALLGEKPRRRDFAFMASLAFGLLLVFIGQEDSVRTAPDPVQGKVLAALCGFTVALMMMGLRWLGRAEAGTTGAPVAVVLGNVLAVVAVLPFGLPVRSARPLDWLLLGYLGVFQIGAAYALLIAGLRHVPVLEATLLMFIEPVLSPLWAWLVHAERPAAWVFAGGAVIVASTALWVALDARRADRASLSM
jgi:drug/metabolite transporter (DMT)-like permease